MNTTLSTFLEHELRCAVVTERAGDLPTAWRHLERAHILSQAFAWPHTRVHMRMLAFGWRRRDLREVLGQIARIIGGGPASLLGRAPRGNTGGARVGIMTPMAIPDDLAAMLDTANHPR